MPICDFSNFVEIALRHGCSPVNLLHISRTLFPKSTSGGLLLNKWNVNFLIYIIFIGETRATLLITSTECVLRVSIYNRVWTLSFIKIIPLKSPSAWRKWFHFNHDISTFRKFILSFLYHRKWLRDPQDGSSY